MMCQHHPPDELHGADNGGGGRAELCPECSQRATLGPADVSQQV